MRTLIALAISLSFAAGISAFAQDNAGTPAAPAPTQKEAPAKKSAHKMKKHHGHKKAAEGEGK